MREINIRCKVDLWENIWLLYLMAIAGLSISLVVITLLSFIWLRILLICKLALNPLSSLNLCGRIR